VARILAYNQAGSGTGVLLVSDSNDGYNFDDATAQVRELIPADVLVEEIDRGNWRPMWPRASSSPVSIVDRRS
jgi:hypothetical protein